jgi:N-acetylglutamate synthase-like GNAT family acetyltransferase
LRVRLAEIADIEAVTAVINVAFRKAEFFLVERDRVDFQAVRAFMEKGKFLVADEDGIIPGCVYVEFRGDRAYLGLLSVDPDRQKSGLGSRLMNEAENFCAQAGCKFMDLRLVSVRRELPAFYAHRGYIETGTSPFHADVVTKIPCHFVNMSKPLR